MVNYIMSAILINCTRECKAYLARFALYRSPNFSLDGPR